MRRLVGAGVVIAALGAFAAPAQAEVLGELKQLDGAAGCVNSDAADGCTQGSAVARPESVVVSPDGAHVYVSQYNFDPEDYALLAFRRDPNTGALTQLPGTGGCISNDGSGGACADGRAISSGDGSGLAISPDGRFVYGASQTLNGLVVFARDPATGVLTQLPGTEGCLTRDGESEDGAGTCKDITGTAEPNALVLSPDAQFLFSSGYGDPENLGVFRRDPATGFLTQLPGKDGCYTVTGASEDGADTCTDMHDAGSTSSLGITPDGRHLYAPHYSFATGVFDVDPATGKLTQKPGTAGCFSWDGSGEEGVDTCLDLTGVAGPYAAVVSLDGRRLYVGGYDDGALAVVDIDPATGAVSQSAAKPCVSQDGSSGDGADTCVDGRALTSIYSLSLSPDGANLYAATDGAGADGALSSFALDPATGFPTQLAGTAGCFTESGDDDDETDVCALARGVGEYGVAVAPDGGSLYTTSSSDRAVGVYRRQASPLCADTGGIAPFGTPLTLALSCRDPNGDPFSIELAGNPTNGTAALAGSSVTYTPSAGYAGADAFLFRGRDAVSAGAPATAAITVDQRPAITALRVASPFAVAKGRTPVSAKVRKGTRIRFRLSEAAAVTLEIQRQLPGRRVRGKCRKLSRGNAGRPRCKRWKRVGRVLRREGKQGQNSVRFTGRIGRKALKAGRYRVVLTATDAVGSKSAATRRKFRVVKAKTG